MSGIKFSVCPALYSSAVKTFDTSIDNLSSMTAKPEIVTDKLSALLFNGCSYKTKEEIANPDQLVTHGDEVVVRRITANLEMLYLLILDYDNKDLQEGMYTLQMAQKDFEPYTHIGYTSFSHTTGCHKFRIVLPLEKPIPINDGTSTQGSTYERLNRALIKRFPEADTASFKPNQMFFMPSATQENESGFVSWVNHGELFDWSDLPLTTETSIDTADALQRQKRFISERFLLPDQELKHARGHVRVKDIKKRIQKVTCPFHTDKRGTEFANVTKDGIPYLHCKRCAKTFYMRDPDRPNWLDNRLINEQALGIDSPYDQSIEFQQADDRSRVNKTLDQIFNKITGSAGFEVTPWGKVPYSHFICLPEGSGKSQLAARLAISGKTIIFASKSYEQLEEKHKEFSEIGDRCEFSVEIVESVDGLFQKMYNCKVVRKPSKNPYSLAPIDTQATIEEVVRINPNANREMIKLRMALHKASDYRFPSANPDPSILKPTRIVLMTFTMLRVLPSLNCWPDDGSIIWFDDPDRDDLIDISPKNIVSPEELSSDLLRSEIFFMRPRQLSLGRKTKRYCQVITTTERICLRLAEKLFSSRGEKYITHYDMHHVDGGKITIIGTKMVRKEMDGLIPVLLNSIGSGFKDLLLISDGLATEYNHSNSKGKNNLSNKNTVIEVSCPHPTEINVLCAALDTSFKASGRKLTIDIMLDKMHQALGRNSGYRSRGNSEAVVLVDPNHHESLVEGCRYMVDIDNSVLIDRTQSMSRLDKRISNTATPLVAQLERAINQPDKILLDNRIAKPAIKAVFSEIKAQDKLEQYLFRLTLALSTIGKYAFLDPQLNRFTIRQRKIFELSQWVLDTFSNESTTQRVNNLHLQYESDRKKQKLTLKNNRGSIRNR